LENLKRLYIITKNNVEKQKISKKYNDLYNKYKNLIDSNELNHANDNNKKHHANDNNKNVLPSVRSKKTRKSNNKCRVNYKIRNDGIYSLPNDLRGLPNNKWGGNKPSSLTKVKGTFGAANAGRSLQPAEYAADAQRYIDASNDLVAKSNTP